MCVSPIHRLCVADVGQKKRIVSAVADIRKITTVSINQSMLEAYQKKCIGWQLLHRNILDLKEMMLSGWADSRYWSIAAKMYWLSNKCTWTNKDSYMKRTLRRLKSRQGQCLDGRDRNTRVKGLTRPHTFLPKTFILWLNPLATIHAYNSRYK
jgi:hypothetical protein